MASLYYCGIISPDMIDLSTEEWKTALRLVRAALDDGTDASRAAAFDFMRTAE